MMAATKRGGETWSKEWIALIAAYGNADASFTDNWQHFASLLHVTGQTVWRWARGANVPVWHAERIRQMAQERNLKSPV